MRNTVLIVDDNLEICELLTTVFKYAGYDAYSVVNGKDAIEFLSNNHVDIMTLDNDMPGLSGLQILRFIKDTHIADATKIIMVTANDSIIFDNDDIGLADLVIMKPIAFKQLTELANRLLSPAQA